MISIIIILIKIVAFTNVLINFAVVKSEKNGHRIFNTDLLTGSLKQYASLLL